MIVVRRYNSVFDAIECDPSTAQELQQYFTFTVPSYQYMGKKKWDGKAYLFKKAGTRLPHRLFCGLRKRLYEYCLERQIELHFEFDVRPFPLTAVESLQYVESLRLPMKIRDYQLYAFNKAIRNGRQLIICPTGSGKSLIIYLITAFLASKRMLIIVPTLNLIQQMFNDFKVYSNGVAENHIHLIYSGQERWDINKPIIISTWQSLQHLPAEWFSRIDAVMCDEVHLATAKSLTNIMSNCVNTEYRFGTTGTLDDLQVHRLQLEGLFGPVIKPTTSAELIEKDTLADIAIKVHVLTYSEQECQLVGSMNYAEESDFLVRHDRRNTYISELAKSCEGNTLVLFRLIEHGKELYNRLKWEQRPIYYMDGSISGDEREHIRNILEAHTDALVIASYGVFSTGNNNPSLRNLIFASPYKSKIKVLQSIGRVLRRIPGQKENAILHDIADNLFYNKQPNTTLRHLIHRMRYYKTEKFPFEKLTVEIGGM